MLSVLTVVILCLVCLLLLEKPYSRHSPNFNFAINLVLICITALLATNVALSRPELDVVDRIFVYLGAIVLLCFGTLKTYLDWVNVKHRIEESRKRFLAALDRAAHMR